MAEEFRKQKSLEEAERDHEVKGTVCLRICLPVNIVPAYENAERSKLLSAVTRPGSDEPPSTREGHVLLSETRSSHWRGMFLETFGSPRIHRQMFLQKSG